MDKIKPCIENYFTAELIDGQPLRVIKKELKHIFFKDINCVDWFYTKFHADLKKVIQKKCELTLRGDDLWFGFNEVSARCLVYFLYNKKDEIFRVHFEEIECSNCCNRFLIANPFIIDNYLGVKNSLAIERQKRAEDIVDSFCSACNNRLPRKGFILESTVKNL